jgi:hypothetical protein
MGRENNFTYEGLGALYDYLTDIEEAIGEEIELDVIALCCEFTEYENWDEFKKDYPSIADDAEDIALPDKEYQDDDFELNDYKDELLEQLSEHTQVINIPNSEGFIIQGF